MVKELMHDPIFLAGRSEVAELLMADVVEILLTKEQEKKLR